MIRQPPRSTLSSSSAASDVYKRQGVLSPKSGTMGVSVMSHTSLGLGQAGDVSHLLGRLAGEQLEQLLDRYAGDDRHSAQCRGGLLLGEVLAQEPDRAPVRGGHLDADLPGEDHAEVLVPFAVRCLLYTSPSPRDRTRSR